MMGWGGVEECKKLRSFSRKWFQTWTMVTELGQEESKGLCGVLRMTDWKG